MNKYAIISMVALLVCIMSASATVTTFNTPADGAIVRDGTRFGASIDAALDSNNNQCSWFLSSPSTANTTVVVLMTNSTITSSNLTRNMTYVEATYIIEDSTDYTVFAGCYNGSAWVNSTSKTLTFDRSAPDTPTTTETTQKIKSSKSISYTVGDFNTTGCTLYLGTVLAPSQYSYAMTYSGTTCSKTISESLNIPDGTYNMYAAASDGTNTTNSATLEGITISFRDEINNVDSNASAGAKTVADKKFLLLIMGVIALIIITSSKKR